LQTGLIGVAGAVTVRELGSRTLRGRAWPERRGVASRRALKSSVAETSAVTTVGGKVVAVGNGVVVVVGGGGVAVSGSGLVVVIGSGGVVAVWAGGVVFVGVVVGNVLAALVLVLHLSLVLSLLGRASDGDNLINVHVVPTSCWASSVMLV